MGPSTTQAAPRGNPVGGAGSLLLLALIALTLVGFAVTRGVRVRDDIVNTVRISTEIGPGEKARIRFTTTIADDRADVLITDSSDRQVRALALGVPLGATVHRYTWDGTGDDGRRVAAGEYGIRVILGEAGRDIKPPGRVRVLGPGAAAG